jgi:hypothetical protein
VDLKKDCFGFSQKICTYIPDYFFLSTTAKGYLAKPIHMFSCTPAKAGGNSNSTEAILFKVILLFYG